MSTITAPTGSAGVADRLPTLNAAAAVLRVALTIAVLAVAAGMLVPGLLGLQRYVIVGGSMEPTIPQGSLAYGRAVPVAQLEVGDVITFLPPGRSAGEQLVTHRIVAVNETAGVGRTFVTKGDANDDVDPWEFSFDEAVQPKVAFHVPHVGHVYAALQMRNVRLIAIGVPAAVIGLVVLRQIANDLLAGRRARRSPSTSGA
jgi:signal peptidase I